VLRKSRPITCDSNLVGVWTEVQAGSRPGKFSSRDLGLEASSQIVTYDLTTNLRSWLTT